MGYGFRAEASADGDDPAADEAAIYSGHGVARGDGAEVAAASSGN